MLASRDTVRVIPEEKTAIYVPNDSVRKLGSEINIAKYYTVKIPKQLSFAGESVPLSDFEVKERLDRELLVNGYWQSNTIQNLKLSHRYFPDIEKKLKEAGVPDDFKYVAMAESGFRNVTSPGNAEGIWQFLEGTAEKYDLTVNSEVDQRYDIDKATDAAIAYFKEAYGSFHNWTLSAASYNAGIGTISNLITNQKESSYYDLYMNNETSRYIFRILAMKVICENAEQYGFMLDDDDYYRPLVYKTVSIDTTIHSLVDFAKSNETNYKMLKYYNPWLQSTSLTLKKGEHYDIRIPENIASTD